MFKAALFTLIFSVSIFAQVMDTNTGSQPYSEVAVGDSYTLFNFPDGWEITYDPETEMHEAVNSDQSVVIILQEINATADEILAVSKDRILESYTDVEFDNDQSDNFNGFDVKLMAAMGKNPDSGEKVLVMIAIYTIDESTCIQLLCEINSEPDETNMDEIKGIATSIRQ